MLKRRVSRPVLVGIVVVAAVPLSATGAAATGSTGERPFVRGTQTVATYSYADAIRESVWVTTPTDTDRDGQPDRVAVDVIRPREAAAAGIRVPVIMDASPYYLTFGRGNEGERKQYDSAGTIAKFPLFYDNYFVPRGYAVVQVDLAGTSRSTGCGDVGGRTEVGSVTAAIDWLNGRTAAQHSDGTPAAATWSTGKVGMIGKSWDGSVANAVAATGIDGLATVVPIAAISSWYDYYRVNGVVRWPDGPAGLAGRVSGRPPAVCSPTNQALRAGADDSTGNYNAFWAERDYRPDASKVRASVFVVHGRGDLNVMTSQFGQWWTALASRGVPRKLWLSQTGHVDPFDFRRAQWVDTLHRWFDYWLQGLRNGIMAEPAVSVERAPGQWVDERSWPATGSLPVSVPLAFGDANTGTIGAGGPAAGPVRRFTDRPDLREADAVSDPSTAKPGRLVFLSGTLPADVRISGTATVTLRIRVDRPTTEVTARLVDYGTATRLNYLSAGEGVHNLPTQSCWGDSVPVDDGCYYDLAEDVVTSDLAVLTRGWADAGHYRSLTGQTPLEPTRWYSLRVPLQSHDAVVLAGHVLGLVITGTDAERTSPGSTGATVEVDVAHSMITLPVAGAATLPLSVPVPPRVDARITGPTVTADPTGRFH
ncbi:Xaa-Pro dipeptidyl-peptidase [Planosporangium mesophilum]|uniref:X-Pro dipeptidyl-peptidase n=1 Tax=Planosporangium mesophilum TaxID=689768 RepID=A0A8J3X4U2_9ACTN|nr:Xaa-Pro dipeptidyl-peptidase [Planosporangium mesophilum]NJC86697.1 Xaa-Pro dipeptidyl-peptidase [Planosporangium mesophilum]GII24123.1 X-Pro dipeptidyl-peptidase [Planosporangium mesophilum]